ncbi:hypothetical protein BJ964_009411 [Actinoplanes lobatus]|uniref:ATPase AAA-type core domain-containing protein n=1 Tax=Actinoplanes lobatus TaxID=113568 RepID=A0A7W7MMI8_9ACTN|nr:hypothetical protein [Actinoplanes lobatus]
MALAAAGPDVARNLVADFGSWISIGVDNAMVTVRLEFDPAVDRFANSHRPPDESFRAGLAWSNIPFMMAGHPENQPALMPVRFLTGPDADPDEPDIHGDASRRGPWRQNPLGWLCVGYGPFRRLAGGSGDAQRLKSSRVPAARMASLFYEDASLADGVTWLIEQHLRALEQRPGAEELKDAALAVLGDGLLPDRYQVCDVDSEGLWVERDGNRFALREMSDGYRTVAALVVDLLKQIHDAHGRLPVDERDGSIVITAPGVVLIDEVDAHLHVSWQQRIGGWLKTHFPRIQFIVTTHSPYICQAADENGLIRLPGPEEEQPPRIVGRDMYERIVYGSGDDAVMSELFGLDTPYSDVALRLRRELVDLETDVLLGRAGADAVRRYEQLRDKLTSSPVARVEELAARIVADRDRPER